MVNYTILAGGFSSFIASYLFDSDANSLTLLKQNPTGENPSWIASNLQNKSILYAVNEIQPVGNLQSFVVGSDGGLTLVDTVTSGGNGPTFTNPLSTGEVTGMNFGSPNCSLVATVPGDPLHFQTNSPIVAFPVPEGAPSNPHMSLEVNDEVLVSDLGGDKIWRLARNGAPGNFKVQGQINIDPGAGPRHMAMLDNVLFTVHEKTSTLTAQMIPQGPNGTTLPLIANVSVIPPNPPQGSQFAAAEILISTPTSKFPSPLIYVSNRNIGSVTDPKGDTIAIFEFTGGNASDVVNTNAPRDLTSQKSLLQHCQPHCAVHGGFSGGHCKGCDNKGHHNNSNGDYNEHQSGDRYRMKRVHRKRAGGSLQLVAQVFTGLDQIRSMNIGRVEDGGDEFLVASGFAGTGGVVMFQRVDGGRNLQEVARNKDVPTRTSFVFV